MGFGPPVFLYANHLYWLQVKRTLLSWSSGKDSAWCLHRLRQSDEHEVVALLTTFNSAADRVAMHGVRRSLVREQSEATALPLWDVELPWPCSNEQYEAAMRQTCKRAVAEGIECVAFGDLFLKEVREYREKQMQGTHLEAVFPLWGLPTHNLAREMITNGLRARISCVDTKQVGANFVGRDFDEEFLRELPMTADPCGENGEFHSFVYAGPMFSRSIAIDSGEIVTRDGFTYCDLVRKNKIVA